MDDLFKILIWGIIIFSFLRPLFKKKDIPKQTQPARKDANSAGTVDSFEQSMQKEGIQVAAKNDEYDILRELENMFKGNLKIPEQPKPKQVDPYDIYQSHEIKDKDLDLVVDKRMQRDVQDKNPIGSRKTYDETIIERKSISDKQKRVVDPKIEAGAKEFERVLAGPRKQRAAISDFNRKLKNPRTVREYILFSEILGKPKALRR